MHIFTAAKIHYTHQKKSNTSFLGHINI